MQFNLVLEQQQANTLLPFNYQYPLSAAIYKIIQRADADFANFLHNSGYGEGHKSFKLFTFSDLQTAFKVQGDRMQLPNNPVQLRICFHVQQAAETFVRGLFMHQQLDIADNKSKASFLVQHVEALHARLQKKNTLPKEVIQVTLQPLSPVVTGFKNSRGHYDYLSPSDTGFTDSLLHNLIEKYKAVQGIAEWVLPPDCVLHLKVLPQGQPAKQRLVAIKAGTPCETRVRGYTKFLLSLKAPAALIELALNAGIGLHNAQGMGCVELYNSNGILSSEPFKRKRLIAKTKVPLNAQR